jgi:hypothetical protein
VFLDRSHSQNIPGGACIITKKLPESNGEFEYRVRSVNEPYERVVRESELKRRTLGRQPDVLDYFTQIAKFARALFPQIGTAKLQ